MADFDEEKHPRAPNGKFGAALDSTARAHSLTGRAKVTATKVDHVRAAKAHGAAANAHEAAADKARDPARAAAHAAAHLAAAAKHVNAKDDHSRRGGLYAVAAGIALTKGIEKFGERAKEKAERAKEVADVAIEGTPEEIARAAGGALASELHSSRSSRSESESRGEPELKTWAKGNDHEQ